MLQGRTRGRGSWLNIEALITRMGFGGILYYTYYSKEPRKPYFNIKASTLVSDSVAMESLQDVHIRNPKADTEFLGTVHLRNKNLQSSI